MISNSTKLALIANSLAALAIAAPTHAAVMSSSAVDLTDFVMKRASTGVVLDVSDLTALTFTSSADHSVDLFGTTLSNTSAVAPINFAPICVGGGCNPILPDNTFPKLAAPATGDYSAADQFEDGAPITGIPGFAIPAHVANASYVGIVTGIGSGSANSNNNLNASWVFSLAGADALTFEFDADAYLQAAVTASEGFPGFATAAHFVTFSITDLASGAEVWAFNPNGVVDVAGETLDPWSLNRTISLSAPLPVDVELIRDSGGPVMFSSTTPVLGAGTLYQLSARINTNADAARVPEPGVLALLSLGLIGLGITRRPSTSA